MKVKFLLFADLHVDMMHDGAARAQGIFQAAKAQGAEMAVQLGDLMYPAQAYLTEKGRQILRDVRPWALDRDDERAYVWQAVRDFGAPLYSVLGNHDLHVCDKQTAVKWLSMPAPYYDFVQGGVRFVALDTNFVCKNGVWEDMQYGSSAGVDNRLLRYVPDEQLTWLRQRVMTSDEPCVLLSHASLCDPLAGIQNRDEVIALIRACNRDRRRVLASFSGHSHVDGMTVIDRVPYINVNSASYHWLGADYKSLRYSEKLCRHYPRLMSTAPYLEVLYALVEMDDGGMRMTGRSSIFVGKTPQELGLPESENDHQPTAVIRDRSIAW